MIKIAAGLSFYNDLDSLKRGIPTYANEVDYIFAIDGRYSLCEGDDYSSKETLDYLAKFPNLILKQFVGMEHDKRMQYFYLAEEHQVDVLLLIDSDEYVLPGADWKLFRNNLEQKIKENPEENIFGTQYRTSPEGKPEHFTTYARLIVRPEELEHFLVHCYYRKRDNGTPSRITGMHDLVEGIQLAGDDSLRSDEYLKQVTDYQHRMLEYEVPIREKLREGLFQ